MAVASSIGKHFRLPSQNLVNQLYALGRLGLSSSPLVGAICEAIDRGPPLKEEGLMVNTYYALAKLHDGSEKGPQMILLRRITNQFTLNGQNYQFSPQHIANILHASCDLANSLTQPFTPIIAGRIPEHWEAFTPQLFGSALLSCAKLKIRSDELWKDLREVCRKMMIHSDCRSDRDIAVALAATGMSDREFWEAAVGKQRSRIRELPLPVLTTFLYSATYAGYVDLDYIADLSSEVMRRSRNIPFQMVEGIGGLMGSSVGAEKLSSVAPWDVVSVMSKETALTSPLDEVAVATYFEASPMGASGNAFAHVLRLLQRAAPELDREELLLALERWARVGEEDLMEPLVYAMEKMIIDQPIDLLTLAKSSKYLGLGQRRGLSRATATALVDLGGLPATAVIACSAILLPQVDLPCRARIFESLSSSLVGKDIPIGPVLRLCRSVCDLQPSVDSSVAGAAELGRTLRSRIVGDTTPSAILSAAMILTGEIGVERGGCVLEFGDVADVCRLLEACNALAGETVDWLIHRDFNVFQLRLLRSIHRVSDRSWSKTLSRSLLQAWALQDFTLASRYLRAAGEALSRSASVVDTTIDLTVLQEVMVRKSPTLHCCVSALLFCVARLETVERLDGGDYDTLTGSIAELLDRLSRYKGQLSSETDAKILKRCVEALKVEHREWYEETIPVSVRAGLDTIRLIVQV